MSGVVRSVRSMACALGISIGVAACGGGGAAGPSPAAYCQQFQQDWSTFQQATAVINDATAFDMDLLDDSDQDSDRQTLIANNDVLDRAAAVASDLAKLAPERLEEGYPWGTMTPRKMFEDMAAALVKAGQGDLSARDDAIPNHLFLPEGTGCNFRPATETGGIPDPPAGPDGTVATEMWQP